MNLPPRRGGWLLAVLAALGLLAAASRVAADEAATPAATAAPPAGAGAAKPATREERDADFGKRKEELGKLPKPADLRPTGPINITAKRAELVQGTSAVYSGNVAMDSDTIKLDGDRMELKQYPSNQYEAKLFGSPAHMSHAGTGPDDPSMTARAKTITYDSRSGIVDLIGDALVTKGSQTMNADTIHYNLAENGIQADGGEGHVVHMVIPPATPDPASPASASPPGSAPTP